MAHILARAQLYSNITAQAELRSHNPLNASISGVSHTIPALVSPKAAPRHSCGPTPGTPDRDRKDRSKAYRRSPSWKGRKGGRLCHDPTGACHDPRQYRSSHIKVRLPPPTSFFCLIVIRFKSIGAAQIKFSRQAVFTLDHDVQNKSAKNLAKYANIEAFARAQGVDFYPAGRGIGHQILIEEGYAFPYTLTVASDSHSNMYGGVGCVGTPIVRTDAAAIWATGKTWWQVPRMVKVELRGKLHAGVTGKDVIVALCGAFNKDEVLNAAIEFTGDGVAGLSIDDRLTIANMTTEWGALVGLFPVDEALLQWYEAVLKKLELRTFSVDSSIPPPPEHPRIIGTGSML
jgi:hypothetical protein